MSYQILEGDVFVRIKEIPDASVHCVVTSPPYWGLRDYETGTWEGGDPNCKHRVGGQVNQTKDAAYDRGTIFDTGQRPGVDASRCKVCGAVKIDAQLGLEKTPEEYIAKMVAVFAEVRRVLRSDGVLWLNIGDSYCAAGGDRDGCSGNGPNSCVGPTADAAMPKVGRVAQRNQLAQKGIKPKDLVGIPWMLAFALRADGWWLRQDIIWCLSGGTLVYARTQKGDMPMMIRDLARLRPETIQLWNGEKWTRLLGISKSRRSGREIELVLRSGERISCTQNHKFPTSRGLMEAGDICVGDKLTSCRLPEPSLPKSSVIDNDAAWLAGLYIAEGSMSGGTIQIAGHSKEVSRWIRLCAIATKYGGSCTQSIDGNKMNIRLYGKVLVAILSELVTGRTAKNKGFAPVVWRHSDSFVGSMLSGYLSGDGAYSKERWRLGFTRNYNLERDLRTACARLGYTITLNPSAVEYKGKRVPTFRGEIRETRSGHHNEKDRNEVVEIRKARCREVYDLGVEDESHVFALASGVLTHNSKPNPMPESVQDRCTKSHEYVFLLTKSARYFYDAEAIKEQSITGDARKPFAPGQVDSRANGHDRGGGGLRTVRSPAGWKTGNGSHGAIHSEGREKTVTYVENTFETRNKRSVWEISTQPFPEAHFATFPEALVEPCIFAGTSEKGCCAKCGVPYERVTEKSPMVIDRSERTHSKGQTRSSGTMLRAAYSETVDWEAGCKCGADVVPCTVFDPFAGSGTVGVVALNYHRDFIGIELNQEYAAMARNRITFDSPLFNRETAVEQSTQKLGGQDVGSG